MIAGHLPLSIVETFRNGSSSKDDIKAAGVEVFKFLLTKGKRQELSLDELRLQKFKIICGKGKLYPERLPPTQGAAKMHALRVYWNCHEWYSLSECNLSGFGWKKVGTLYHPIGTLKSVGTEKLLNFISCRCEKGCRGRCSCINNGIKCVSACLHCKGTLCENIVDPYNTILDDTDDEDSDDGI